jgi:uncharacterized membrane protein YcaP (DUF421 family)
VSYCKDTPATAAHGLVYASRSRRFAGSGDTVCPCVYASWWSKNAERLFEGVPKILVRNGQVRRLALIQERITRSELIEALRREGCTSLSRVRFAVLETDGTITVGLRCNR